MEAVGTKFQDSMEIKSLGQKGPSCRLFFRGARLVGPQQEVPGAAFTPLEGSRDPISGLWKFLGGVFGVFPQAALFPLTSLASPFFISSPDIQFWASGKAPLKGGEHLLKFCRVLRQIHHLPAFTRSPVAYLPV